jgi:hypothetical protein
VKLTFPTSLTATGVTRPPGTLLDGYGAVYFGASSGTCTVDFAGPSDLNGTGVLCYVQFAAGANAGGAVVTVANAIFNETLPAKATNGTITILALPAITVLPDIVTLLAGATQTFTVSGTPVLPLTWSLTDSSVGTINSSGLFTAVHGGTTQVRAQDNVGATDLNTLVDVYDFRATAATISVMPGGYVNLPIYADRKVGTLGIRSVQYELSWTGPYVTSVASTSFGLIAGWSPNLIATTPTSNLWRLVAASAQPLANTDSVLHRVRFNIAASAPVGTNIPITLVSFLCNEGAPRVLKTNGVIQVRTTTDVPGDGIPASFALAPPRPNPAAGRMLLRFAIPRSDQGAERVRLMLISIDGRLVRSVVDEPFPAGTHEALWDGRDDNGHSVAAGVYFARLEWQGRSETRKVAVVR